MECDAPRNWLDNGWMLLQWCTLNHDETWRCAMECKDAWWNVKMCNEMQRCVMECKDAWWNAKMHNGMQRCVMECKDAQWNAKMRENAKMHENMKMRKNAMMCENAKMCNRMWRCVTMWTKRECGNASCKCRTVSWVHDGDVVLWSPVVMSHKLGQYQPVENWVSTVGNYNSNREGKEKCCEWGWWWLGYIKSNGAVWVFFLPTDGAHSYEACTCSEESRKAEYAVA